ncbi:SdpI family protein [Nocardia brasiliensis]|uniref:SdpI family protein n=1 Tax=Nocardia brasiliensis TaxID=37326 RepID=UPI0004A6CA1C|nr:SdpI family protein [Nocardia brasiliensis]MBF6127914.1 SdpI family protein [Nocardia brasiliensis]MBF6546755.1 SdpI family protein [Nocardia brasiliensis]
MFVVALVLFVLGLVALATGALGLTGRLPRNRFVGVHTEAALSDDETFRVANRIAAPTSLAAGALLLAGGLVVLAAGGFAALFVAVGVAVVALFTLGAGANAAAARAAAIAPPAEVGGCGSACGACSLRDACQPAT